MSSNRVHGVPTATSSRHPRDPASHCSSPEPQKRLEPVITRITLVNPHISPPSPYTTAEQSETACYRRKPSGNTLAVREQPRRTTLEMTRLNWGSTPGTATMLGRSASGTLTVQVRCCPTHGVCTTCTAMLGNGAKIGIHPTLVKTPSVTRRVLQRASSCASWRLFRQFFTICAIR